MVVSRKERREILVGFVAYVAALVTFLIVVFVTTGAWGQAGTAGDPRHNLTKCIGLEYGNNEAENYNWDRIDKFLCAIQNEDLCAEIANCATCPLGCLSTTSTSSTTTTSTTTTTTSTTCIPGDVPCDPEAANQCCQIDELPTSCVRLQVDPPIYECHPGCPTLQPCDCPPPAFPGDPDAGCPACNDFPCAAFGDPERLCECGT